MKALLFEVILCNCTNLTQVGSIKMGGCELMLLA